jgi:hypothetical protein
VSVFDVVSFALFSIICFVFPFIINKKILQTQIVHFKMNGRHEKESVSSFILIFLLIFSLVQNGLKQETEDYDF